MLYASQKNDRQKDRSIGRTLGPEARGDLEGDGSRRARVNGET
jgi:hypothetical protein